MLRKIRDLIFFSLLILALYLFAKVEIYHSKYWPEVIRICNVKLTAADSIIYQSDTTLIPVNYIGSIDFRNVDPNKRKDLFIMHILPAIVITRERLMDELHHIEFIEERTKAKREISKFDSTFLATIQAKYETDSLTELKKRIYPHPVSLALTQAVLESGWGTSNVFRNANNIFGVMSFSSDDTRSLIQYSEDEEDRYIRTYSSILESVEHYYLLISTVSFYRRFREKRWEGRTSYQLLRYLKHYHDGSDQYAEMAQSIITSNNLDRFDNIVIDPRYKELTSLGKFLMKY